MKIQRLLEMPEVINQAEISLPLKNVQVNTTLWTCPTSTPNITLAAHPIKGSQSIMVMAYEGDAINPSTAIAGMFLSSGKQLRHTVYGIQVAKKARGRGIALDMYVSLAKHKGFTLISDDVQTEGGSGIWVALNRRFPGCVGVYTETGDIIPIGKFGGDAFNDPMTQLAFSLNSGAIKKSA